MTPRAFSAAATLAASLACGCRRGRSCHGWRPRGLLGRLHHGGVEGVHTLPGNEVDMAVALLVRQALPDTAVERVGLAVVPPPSPRWSAPAGAPACAGVPFAGARQIGSRAKRTQKKSDNPGGRRSRQSPGCCHVRFQQQLGRKPGKPPFQAFFSGCGPSLSACSGC